MFMCQRVASERGVEYQTYIEIRLIAVGRSKDVGNEGRTAASSEECRRNRMGNTKEELRVCNKS